MLGAYAVGWLENLSVLSRFHKTFEHIGAILLILSGLYMLNAYSFSYQVWRREEHKDEMACKPCGVGIYFQKVSAAHGSPQLGMGDRAPAVLYHLVRGKKPGGIAFAVAHCTTGDILIGIAALLLALILSRAGELEDWPMKRVGMITIVLAVSYTLPSERINISLGNWAYSSWMPVLPGVGVGLSPLLQWIVVPLAALWWAQHR